MWRPPLRNIAESLVEEHTPGDVPGASWWVLHGNAEPEVQIDLTLEFGSSPAVSGSAMSGPSSGLPLQV